MEYVITANRSFEEIEARTIEALERRGFLVQRTFSLHSATGGAYPEEQNQRGQGQDIGPGSDKSPGYSVLLLYSTGARRQPLGLVTLYERQGKTVINSLPTSPGNEDVEAELTVALALGGLDTLTELGPVLAVSSDGYPPSRREQKAAGDGLSTG